MYLNLLILVALIAFVLCIARYYRKPLKLLIQDFIGDVREICTPAFNRTWCVGHRLWMFYGPRLTNRALWMAAFADIGVVASGRDAWVWIAQHPSLALGIMMLNLWTPLTPSGAPTSIPPAPTRALLNV